MIKHRHTGIVCNDIDKMIASYKGLGLTVQSDIEDTVRIVKFKEGLELLQYGSQAVQSKSRLLKQGISHIAFTIDPEGNCVESVYERTG